MYKSEKFKEFMVQQNWLKRFNSLSLLNESTRVDFDERHLTTDCGVSWKEQQQKVLSSARLRTRSNNYVEDNILHEEFLQLLAQGHDMLRRRPKKFPFQSIPVNCKLRVFSFLGFVDRGRAAQVCSEWSVLMKSFKLWDTIDLTLFTIQNPHSEDILTIYEIYKCSLQKFLHYITCIGAPLKRLSFAYDIGDHRDGWLDILQSFLRSVPCEELEFAKINWKETPAHPPDSDLCNFTWCTSDYNDLMYRQRHRQRIFVKFFDFFTAIAPAIQQLILPFDWSERSVQMLNRLCHLKILNLEKYFLFQGLEQRIVDQLMMATPRLTHLTIDVWTPSGHGLQLYKMHSPNIHFLDISKCRGFSLMDVNLPCLEELRITRCLLYGPILSNDQPDIPCLGDVLRKGAGGITMINFQKLNKSWHSTNCPEFDLVLQSVCSCSRHKHFK